MLVQSITQLPKLKSTWKSPSANNGCLIQIRNTTEKPTIRIPHCEFSSCSLHALVSNRSGEQFKGFKRQFSESNGKALGIYEEIIIFSDAFHK